jgi:hypothetical protein
VLTIGFENFNVKFYKVSGRKDTADFESFAEMSLPIETIKLPVYIAGDGFLMFVNSISIVPTATLAINKLPIVNILTCY